jgi:hypothetical protein
MKDSVLHRSKAFNVQQLVDFIVTRLDCHYQRRLLDIANNRLDNVRYSRFVPKRRKVAATDIVQVNENTYTVNSQSKAGTQYVVDMNIGACSCYVGCTGGPCKHQSAVALVMKLPSWNMLPVNSAAMRQLLCEVALGSGGLPSADWFQSLRSDNDAVQTASAQTVTTALPAAEPEVEQTSSSADIDADMQPDDADQTLDQFTAACSKIAELYKQAPSLMRPAMESFCRQTSNMSTMSAMQSALMCFGKYSGCGSRMSSGKKIGVQPTAVARRKCALGGRRRLHVGRTPLAARAAEHGYSANVKSRRHVMPRRSAPHSLASAVSNVESIGRTHSAK